MKKAVLTPKREQFAVAIAGGMTQTDAYKHAYPASLKWKPESVWSKASELMTNVKVLERIEQLRDRLANRTILKRADVLDEIRRSEEHTSELQSLMRISYAVFCLNTKTPHT